MAFKIHVGTPVKAQRSDRAADSDVQAVEAGPEGLTFTSESCENGWLRRITVNGVCYGQMCCNNTWWYYYRDTPNGRVWCTCNLGQSWSVNCSGETYFVACR